MLLVAFHCRRRQFRQRVQEANVRSNRSASLIILSLWILGWLSTLVPHSSAIAQTLRDDNAVEYVAVDGDKSILDVMLRNEDLQNDPPTAEVALRNQHSLWYVVTQKGLA